MSSGKRENNNIDLTSNNIILDIEGTTTSISFVKDVLFPYVRKHLETYVKENLDSEGFQAIVNALKIQAKEDKENKLDGVIDIPDDCEKENLAKAIIDNVLWQMDNDRKTKSLKDLQGLIMEAGYKNGDIKGHVYEDFEPNLKLWVELGKSVYIYSSGSVHAQKLLFGHSEKGDLLPFIKGHFDTTVGMKGEIDSYKKIIDQIGGSPLETVFFTDVPAEAKAAKEAGLQSILLSREGNAPLTDEDRQSFQVVKSFSETQFENTLKRRKVCTDDEKNDNKLVESCEVSLNPLKEPSNSTTAQESDTAMEVDDISTEGKESSLNKSNENRASEEDIEMESTNEAKETKDSKKDANVIEAKSKEASSQEEVSSTVSGENKSGMEESGTGEKKLNEGEIVENSVEEKKVESVVNGCDADGKSNIEESQQCEEDNNLKENPELTKPSQDVDKITEALSSEDCTSKVQQNGVLANKSVEKCDQDVVMEKNSEEKNKVPDLSAEVTAEETDKPNSDLSCQKSTPVDDEKKISTDIIKDVDENTSSDNNDSNVTSTENVLPAESDAGSNKVNGKADENNVIESVKESSVETPTESSDKNEVKGISSNENEVKQNDVSESVNSNTKEEISPETNKPSEVDSVKSDDSKICSEPCNDETANMPSAETCSKPEESSSKTDKTEIGELNKMEVSEDSKSQSDESKVNVTVSEPDSDAQPEKKAEPTTVAETPNESDSIEGSQKNTEEKIAEQSSDVPNVKEQVAGASVNGSDDNSKSVLNGNNDNSKSVNGTDKNSKSVNGKDDDSKSSDSEVDKESKNGMDETPICEVKKCEVPENTVIPAVVEA